MEKANVLKALELCSNGGSCSKCPYTNMPDCDSKLCSDAATLIKANEAPKPKYSLACIYTKQTNLSDYLTGKTLGVVVDREVLQRKREYYAREREVQLIAMFRWEKGKCFCRIKCPINPLPVKGEFEVPSTGVVADFIVKNGWTFKQRFYPHMFN